MEDSKILLCTQNSYGHAKGFLRSLLTVWARASFASPDTVLLSTSVSKFDVVTLEFQTNKHPPFTTSPHPAGPLASSAQYSTG